jgi:hypothetical protein
MQTRTPRHATQSVAPAISPRSHTSQHAGQPAAPAEAMVRAGQVARRLGITPLMVEQLRRDNRLLAVPCDNGFAYPSWQFEGRGMLSGFPTVLSVLRGHDPAAQLAFFVTPHESIQHRTPLDALRSGDLEAVVRVARS